MTLTELLSELDNNPGAILAWEVDKVGAVSLSVFRLEGGTSQLAQFVVDKGQRAAVTAELDKRALVAGYYASMTGFVWQKLGGTFTVWGSRGRVFTTDGTTLNFKRETLALTPGMEVVAFLDDDLVGRGVRITVGESSHIVARDIQVRAGMDDSYGALDALNDCGWTIYLGRDLADFLGVPLINRTA